MSRLNSVSARFGLVLLACFLLTAAASGQELRASLFTTTDALLAQGKETRADLLAPKSWEKAMERYNSAQSKLTAGKNLDDIRKELTKADGYFQAAIKATDLAKLTLNASLKAHDDAAKVDAVTNAPDLWKTALESFAEAGQDLEDGDVNDARKKDTEAEKQFREAELAAIKTSFFEETRKLLAQAGDQKVEKFAPLTLTRSQALLAEAETVLNENRYDTDRPRSLAMEARYEALHALHLARVVRSAEDEKVTWEELVLDGEAPLTRIAGTLNVQVGFEEGFAEPTETIISTLNASAKNQDALANEVRNRDAQIASLTDQVNQLETKLGGASKAQQALQAQVEAQDLAKRQFAQVEQKFTPDEARILRENGNVIIRLVGMNFASGKSEILPDNFNLLSKVKQAIAMYPGANVSIEGHTDNYGTDEANLKLSQDRASAVAQYLLANSSLTADHLQASGFGESSPIANNETKEGRAKNRRIDVVINPAK